MIERWRRFSKAVDDRYFISFSLVGTDLPVWLRDFFLGLAALAKPRKKPVEPERYRPVEPFSDVEDEIVLIVSDDLDIVLRNWSPNKTFQELLTPEVTDLLDSTFQGPFSAAMVEEMFLHEGKVRSYRFE